MRYALALALLFAGAVALAASSTSPSSTDYTVPVSARAGSPIKELTSIDDAVTLVQEPSDSPCVVFVYDSVDANSGRVVPEVEEGARMLEGFVRVLAMDIRNPEFELVLDAWQVQTVPTLVGVGASHGTRKASNTTLAGIGGPKQASATPPEQQLSRHVVKKFGLGLLRDDVVQRVDSDAKLKPLKELAEAPKLNGEYPFVVLLTDKGASSALYKSVATRYRGRAHFLEVNVKKAKKAGDVFDLAEFPVPTMLLYDANGDRHIFKGAKLSPDSIGAFIDEHVESLAAFEADRRKAELDVIRREHIRRAGENAALFPILTAADWDGEVMAPASAAAGVVGVFFTPAGFDVKGLRSTMADYRRKHGKKSAVQRFVAVEGGKGAKIAAFFEKTCGGGAEASEGDARLFFVDVKEGAIVRFVGSLSVSGIDTFVSGSLARGAGVRKIADDIPDFE